MLAPMLRFEPVAFQDDEDARHGAVIVTSANALRGIAAHLAGSKLLKQLRELDLSMGCMTDAGAAALVEFKDAFKHLDVLAVSENYLTDGGVKALKGLAKKVVSEEQREDEDPEYRSPAIAE